MASLPIKHEPQGLMVSPDEQLNLLRIAVEKGAGIETIERLAALAEKMMQRQAEFEFNEAMNRAQANMRPVAADLENPQTRSKYASYAALDHRVRPIYSKEGFSLSFDTGESPSPDMLRVLCYVSRGGYTRTYKADMPADGKGAKGGDVMTKTHATGAAMSYGMRYLLKMIFNIAVGEDDNDGNEAADAFFEQVEWIANAKDMEELQRLYVAAYKKASASKNQRAMTAIIHAKNKRKAELQ